VHDFGGAARFVTENYGDSALARRYGVTRYPALFVDDVLVATPKDFGFFGRGEGAEVGRYAPLKSAASHERLRADLARMITLLLAGRRDEARAQAAPARPGEIDALPAFALSDLEGQPLRAADLAGRPVLVEFWATWCPPCRGTLAWLGELKKRYGEGIVVVALAVESDEAEVRTVRGALGAPPFRFGMATPELARSFGDLSAVPTLFLFDARGRTAGVFYGAPPTLHQEAEAQLRGLLSEAKGPE